MQGFSLRDYVVSAAVIVGVLVVWFLVLAAMIGLINPRISLFVAVVISLAIYTVIKRRQPKP